MALLIASCGATRASIPLLEKMQARETQVQGRIAEMEKMMVGYDKLVAEYSEPLEYIDGYPRDKAILDRDSAEITWLQSALSSMSLPGADVGKQQRIGEIALEMINLNELIVGHLEQIHLSGAGFDERVNLRATVKDPDFYRGEINIADERLSILLAEMNELQQELQAAKCVPVVGHAAGVAKHMRIVHQSKKGFLKTLLY